MARAVYEEKFGPSLQRCQKGSLLITKIAAGAVDEDNRGQVGFWSGRNMQSVQLVAANIRQSADIGKRALNRGRLPCGKAEQTSEKGEEKDNRDQNI
ncbi:hypothetical protein ACFSE1_06985 [Rhizobium helianthi]|uniref:Uncharacterized protein n=1 Tax=Rhizobium helianthi TaxID=1132695 RepID=A0ABW4M3V9_9HYPH